MRQTKTCLAVVLLVIVAICAAAQTTLKRAAPVYVNPTSGQVLFQNHCAVCHGQQLHGKGPASILLTVPPSDLTKISRRNNGKFPAFAVIEVIRGRQIDRWHQGMPSWERLYSQMYGYSGLEHVAINNLTDYIKSIQE